MNFCNAHFMFVYVDRNYTANSDLQRKCDAASQHVTARSGHTELRTDWQLVLNVAGDQVFRANYIKRLAPE
jgi:hypothetical protein